MNKDMKKKCDPWETLAVQNPITFLVVLSLFGIGLVSVVTEFTGWPIAHWQKYFFSVCPVVGALVGLRTKSRRENNDTGANN
ncbi:hypothetical protein BVX94_03590 [bacterium B17]|nr:hypothetical protein BVX94_03590 [bacterium B17]